MYRLSVDTFQGITDFHDGDVFSDWVNMIPMGSSAIDRDGEKLVSQIHIQGKMRGSFMDSLGTVYVVVGDKLVYYAGDRVPRVMAGLIGGQAIEHFPLKNGNGEVSFCESSTKPSQCFLCDGKYIYWWNTDGSEKFIARMLLSPNAKNSWSDWRGFDQYAALNGEEDQLDVSSLADIDCITWFDNKLVAVERSRNTVWLTSGDPGQFLRTSKDPFGTVPLWRSWYSSSAGSDRLVTAIAFNGQLWFLNETTMEVWGRTGDSSAPIRPNSMSTIYHGGRSPTIVSDTMYMVCKDRTGGEYIGAIHGGAFSRVSTPEIEQRCANGIYAIRPVGVRKFTNICVYTSELMDDGYCFSGSGWWHRVSAGSRYITESVGGTMGVSNDGSLMELDGESRVFSDGTPVVRYIRDYFEQFTARRVISKVELEMDTGLKCRGVGDSAYCRVSLNRGHGFGPLVYRKFGYSGQNDRRLVWRRLGSGASCLVEFGTSAGFKVSVYRVVIETL